jgi:hypothetical protein
MTAIRYLEGGARARTGAGIAPSFGLRRIGGRFQPIVAAAVILLAVGILTEGFLILDRIALLERRMEATETPQKGAVPLVTVRDLNRGLHWLREMEADRPPFMIADPSRSGGSGDWIVLRRSDLERIVNRYLASGASPDLLMQILSRRLPGLEAITVSDGLDRTELKAILDLSPQLVRAVRGS